MLLRLASVNKARMPVYVDQAENGFGRMKMCHMIADTLEELHAMAERIGMRREWFQPKSFPHYDVAKGRRQQAISLGAIVCDRRTFVGHLRRIRTSANLG
jgi:hypothetical protein